MSFKIESFLFEDEEFEKQQKADLYTYEKSSQITKKHMLACLRHFYSQTLKKSHFFRCTDVL